MGAVSAFPGVFSRPLSLFGRGFGIPRRVFAPNEAARARDTGWIGYGGRRQNRRMPDAIFDDPRLARVYDPLEPDRSDLDVYVDMVEELDARSVLDVGCGTGTFACMLARRGVHVTAVDPARASLDVARTKLVKGQVGFLDRLPR